MSGELNTQLVSTTTNNMQRRTLESLFHMRVSLVFSALWWTYQGICWLMVVVGFCFKTLVDVDYETMTLTHTPVWC